MSSRCGVRPKANNSSSNHSARAHKTALALSVDRQDDSWPSRTSKQYSVEEHDSLNGTAVCAESGRLYANGQCVSRTSGRHGTHKKSKSEYLNRKSVPIPSPEADDEDEDYYCGRNSNRGHRILEKYYRDNLRPTVGTTPSRKQWEYRKGVS
jgi:cell division protein FtsI/penicillin-binding protein 2